MPASRFLDTNILVYAYDLDEPRKRAIAMELVKRGWAVPGDTSISVQVLQELVNNLTKKGLSRAQAAQIARDFSSWPIVDNTAALFLSALAIQTRWRLSIWDASILAAARASGATELLTEDLNHGQVYDGVRVVNPFRKA